MLQGNSSRFDSVVNIKFRSGWGVVQHLFGAWIDHRQRFGGGDPLPANKKFILHCRIITADENYLINSSIVTIMKWVYVCIALLLVMCINLSKNDEPIRALPVVESVTSQGQFFYKVEQDIENACQSALCRAAKPKSQLEPLSVLEKLNVIIGQQCFEKCKLVLSSGKVIQLSGTPVHVVGQQMLVLQFDLGLTDRSAIYPKIHVIDLQTGTIRLVRYNFYFRNAEQKCFDIDDFWLDIVNFGERIDDQNIYFLRQDKCGLFNHIVSWRKL
jgi:hypothetical protein